MNHIGFFIGSFVGLFALTCFNIYTRRIVHQMYIFKSGDRVRVQFFNAFWRPKVKDYLISEFNTPVLSFAQFTKVEITSLGNAWLLEDRNIYAKDPEIPIIVKKVLRGQNIDFGMSQTLLR